MTIQRNNLWKSFYFPSVSLAAVFIVFCFTFYAYLVVVYFQTVHCFLKHICGGTLPSLTETKHFSAYFHDWLHSLYSCPFRHVNRHEFTTVSVWKSTTPSVYHTLFTHPLCPEWHRGCENHLDGQSDVRIGAKASTLVTGAVMEAPTWKTAEESVEVTRSRFMKNSSSYVRTALSNVYSSTSGVESM